MTDYDGPPLTRRERKDRERALAEATGQTPAVDAPIDEEPAAEQPAPEEHAPDQEPAAPQEPIEQPAEREQAPEADDAPSAAPRTPEPDETQAIDVSELIADLKPQSTPSPERATPDAPAEGAAAGLGRFFGRRGAVAEPEAPAQPAPESIADVLADLQGDRVDEAREPARPIQRIEVDDLDTVDEADLDRLEIDEVVVAEAPVSSRRIAESTPALLEDRRADLVVEDDEAQVDAETEVRTGPSRATGRMPVIVNVVEDTSRHHISDLREETSAISAASVGTGTSTITANALVLPASGANEPITVETAEGVIVTGSIDLPDGFASSGRSRGTIDTSDVDAADDAGEVRTPETQPVRASRAVSSYANARVRIAPQRRSKNMVPLVIAIGGGVGIAAIATTAIAFIVGWI